VFLQRLFPPQPLNLLLEKHLEIGRILLLPEILLALLKVTQLVYDVLVYGFTRALICLILIIPSLYGFRGGTKGIDRKYVVDYVVL
jgi:hypothetical protein